MIYVVGCFDLLLLGDGVGWCVCLLLLAVFCWFVVVFALVGCIFDVLLLVVCC